MLRAIQHAKLPGTALRASFMAVGLAGLLALGGPVAGNRPEFSAQAQARAAKLPQPKADGMMGFVVERFGSAGGPYDPNACPNGRRGTMRQEFLETVAPPERARLMKPENEVELNRLWQARIYGPNGANVCSNPDMFDRPSNKIVKGKYAHGFDLDQGGSDADSCAHEEFTSPTGTTGIDNQEYRALGCSGEAPNLQRPAVAEPPRGAAQFHASGEWTQVILIKGIDSLERDDDVEVIYANTADRPQLGPKGDFLPWQSFTVTGEFPRRRNVLKGRIVDGVVTTEPQDIELTQTWGQSAVRDLRGRRTTFDFRKARMRLQIQPDGSVSGLLGGYRPVFSLVYAPAIGGVGSALSGIDCAAQLSTLKKLADGLRDPKTGQCTAVSSAHNIRAVPAFVADLAAEDRKDS
jgi:hypothetical protein